MTVRTRIAPSPTGDPHVGTAYTALFNLALARKNGGQFLLRIEDTDRARSTQSSELAIYDCLRWMGIRWDEGPDIGGPYAPYRQSDRCALYREHAEQLIAKGTAYVCFCTPERLEVVRKTQEAAKTQSRYDGHCRELPADQVRELRAKGTPHVVRLKVPSGRTVAFQDQIRGEIRIDTDQVDDQVLLKSDGWPTYHLANVVDDRLMKITHVIRAEEWISSTPKHILLYEAFGWEPPKFAHLPLLRNPDRTKISKRKNPTSIGWYRDQGYLPEALANFLMLQGFSVPDGTEQFGFEKVVEHFGFDRINTTGPVFDLKKLEWLNGQYIRTLSLEDLTERLKPFGAAEVPAERLAAILPLVRERMKLLGEFREAVEFFLRDIDYDVALLVPKKKTPADAVALLKSAQGVLEGLDDLPAETLDARLRAEAERLGAKVGDYLMCLRVAVTGKTATPPLLESMKVLGGRTVMDRIAKAIAKLDGRSSAA